jgi:hypothetical protein
MLYSKWVHPASIGCLRPNEERSRTSRPANTGGCTRAGDLPASETLHWLAPRGWSIAFGEKVH